jgi:hypothetical protein
LQTEVKVLSVPLHRNFPESRIFKAVYFNGPL